MHQIKKHTLNYQNMGYLKWTGAYWYVTKKACTNLDPDGRYLENKKHNCNEKGYPIQYQTRGSERGFKVTDEKLQEMTEDGRLDTLQQIGVRVDGGADPLYFDWHNKIAKEIKNTSKRTNSVYMTLYPYLELPTLQDINFETGENALEFLSQKGFEFYTGESIPRRHEATLRFINKTTDQILLENAKNRYETVLDDMYQANSNPTQYAIEKAFNKGLELAGGNPIVGILEFGYDKIKRLVRVMTNINEQELNALNQRLHSIKKYEIEQGNFIPSIPSVKDKNKGDKFVAPIIGTLTILNIFAILGS